MLRGVYTRKPQQPKPRLAPREKATSNDFCWAAGFYEGEGYCAGSVGTERVAIGQKNLEPLERMQALFGGSLGHYPNRCSQWRVSGARSRGFLMSIYGLLSSRRQEQVRKSMKIGEFKV